MGSLHPPQKNPTSTLCPYLATWPDNGWPVSSLITLYFRFVLLSSTLRSGFFATLSYLSHNTCSFNFIIQIHYHRLGFSYVQHTSCQKRPREKACVSRRESRRALVGPRVMSAQSPRAVRPALPAARFFAAAIENSRPEAVCFRCAVRPTVVRPLTRISRDGISLYLAEECQSNLAQIFGIHVGIVGKLFKVMGLKVKVIQTFRRYGVEAHLLH